MIKKLYMVQLQPPSNLLTLVKLNLFVKKMYCFKKIKLPAQYSFASPCTLSKNGKFIGVLVLHDVNLEEELNFVLIEIESGTVRKYRIVSEELDNLDEYSCLLCNENGWIVKVEREIEDSGNDLPLYSSYKKLYYHLSLDNNLHEANLIIQTVY